MSVGVDSESEQPARASAVTARPMPRYCAPERHAILKTLPTAQRAPDDSHTSLLEAPCCVWRLFLEQTLRQRRRPDDLDVPHPELSRRTAGRRTGRSARRRARPHGNRVEFMGAQFDMGLAWVHSRWVSVASRCPRRPATDQYTPRPRDSRPRVFDILGHGMGAPMLVAHGTRRSWPDTSVPCSPAKKSGASSSASPAPVGRAGLSTRAIQDGDEWVVNGQKVWTTAAQIAKFGMVVTRLIPIFPNTRV